jgi:FkbM family methyltransferase
MPHDLIFDVGCHKGEDAALYLAKGFRVVGVEANPTLCENLRRRFAHEMAEGRFTLVDSAIAETTGQVDFYINTAATIWGTIRGEWATRDAENIKRIVVPSVTFGSLLERYGIPHYLKIDIEGADTLCLEGLFQIRERPAFVSFESDRKTLSSLRAELSILRRLGYRKFQLVNQKNVQKHKPPFPAREGRYVDYKIEPESSGLFGRELAGRWLSSAEFSAKYLTIMARDRAAGLVKRLGAQSILRGSWYDIHASLGGH